jgi:UDP-N-acetylmuramoyl-L-alanyl-D-glutamate--2,6-diaminopimelate ligase
MKLKELVKVLKEKEIRGDLNTEITGIVYDSRQVQPGFLFTAIKGTHQDGHQHAKSAVEKGASALLVEVFQDEISVPQIKVPNSRKGLAEVANIFFDHPTRKLKLVGVTGTNGKTTTTYLCEAIFAASGLKTGVIGTIQYKVGEKLYECKNTTPESLDVLHYFKEMVDSGVGACAMEVSSHALDQGRVHGLLFDAVVFTNLTQDHLDYHKTMEAYYMAKAKLFTEISLEKNPKGVVNVDNEYGRKLLRDTRIPILTYGIDGGDVRAKDISIDWNGTMFFATTPEGDFPVTLKLSGKFNVYNALAAIATGIVLKIPLHIIQKGLKEAEQVRGRFEKVDAGQDFVVIVDYAHTPDGLENLLQSARYLTQGKLIVVFGCGGDRDRGKRPQMGRIAETYADIVVVTSDNPRTEEPIAIIGEIEAGMSQPHYVEVDRKKAIETALLLAQKGDCVVIAGKGHETYQIFKDKTIHFDDREVVLDFFKDRGAARLS